MSIYAKSNFNMAFHQFFKFLSDNSDFFILKQSYYFFIGIAGYNWFGEGKNI